MLKWMRCSRCHVRFPSCCSETEILFVWKLKLDPRSPSAREERGSCSWRESADTKVNALRQMRQGDAVSVVFQFSMHREIS